MSESGPLLIESAQYAPFGEARIVVEVAGRWIAEPPATARESALLIVDGDGLVHRFAEISDEGEGPRVGDEYLGSFVIPARFRRRIASPTALRAGGGSVTVPAATPVRDDLPVVASADRVNAIRASGSDPIATALREELTRRVAEEAGLRRQLADLRSQLAARARNSDRLEQVQAELRAAVAELTERVNSAGTHVIALESSNGALETANASLSSELASLRQTLARTRAELAQITGERDAAAAELSERSAELVVTKVSHETAVDEVDELRRELERGGAELAEVRERSVADEVEEAETLLAETRALTSRLLIHPRPPTPQPPGYGSDD